MDLDKVVDKLLYSGGLQCQERISSSHLKAGRKKIEK
jgi:hypothetical protein